MGYGLYRLAADLTRQQRALEKREAALAAQKTPTETAARRVKAIYGGTIATLITGSVLLFIVCRSQGTEWNQTGLIFLFGFLAFVWWVSFQIFGPQSRTIAELTERRQWIADYEARQNEAIRQQKIKQAL